MRKMLLIFASLLVFGGMFSCSPPTGLGVGIGGGGSPTGTGFSGRFFDGVTGEPLSGVEVHLGNTTDQSDSQGIFSLDLGTSGGEITEDFSLYKDNYRFLFIEELIVDTGDDYYLEVPIYLQDYSAYPSGKTITGTIRDASATEISNGTDITFTIYSRDGTSQVIEDSYASGYSIDTAIDSTDCLIIVEVDYGSGFVCSRDDVNISGSGPYSFNFTDLGSPAYDILSLTADQVDNSASAYFQTEYGMIPAFFKGVTAGGVYNTVSSLSSEVDFNTSVTKQAAVYNPYNYDELYWIQKEYDASFSGLPFHQKCFISTSDVIPLSVFVVLPVIDDSLGPDDTYNGDPVYDEYSRGIDLSSISGADHYLHTLRSTAPDELYLGSLWLTSAAFDLPDWIADLLSGKTITDRFEPVDLGGPGINPAMIGDSTYPIMIQMGKIGNQEDPPCYEESFDAPESGDINIGFE